MKTLTQVEPRTPISTVPFTINASGSYYLTGNLAVGTAGGNAIVIGADEVSLDLNGFTISSTANPASGTAVLINGILQNVTVRNGNIRGLTTFSGGAFTTRRFLDGVAQASATSANLRISDLNIRGMGSDGINLGFNSVPTFVVERCTVTFCAGLGILAGAVRDCIADTAGNHAISADVATNCVGETVNTSNVLAIGVAGTTVENCRGISVSGSGVSAINISNSRGTSASSYGINATTATNSAGTSTDGIGLNATNATNCHGVSSSATGLTAGNATNCTGTSSLGTGLVATAATSCFGGSTSGAFGLDANPGTASFCRGQRAGGTAITAGIAIGCTVVTGTVSSVNKFLGTP